MSLNVFPPKTEVIRWSPQSLADYMKRMKLTGCDRVVMQGSITGARFLNMTDIALQVFPSLYIPIITKIQSDINKEAQKKSFRLQYQKSPNQVFTQHEVWDTYEFGKEIGSDNDYESRGNEEEALSEPEEAEKLQSRKTHKANYKLSAEMVKQPRPPIPAREDYRKAEKLMKPPLLSKVNPTLPRPFKAAAGQPMPSIDRRNKPEQLKGSEAPDKCTNKLQQQRSHKLPDVSNRMSKNIPAPPVATQLAKTNNLLPSEQQDLHPSWYGGKLSRHQAEVALKELNKDGAFIVRDSSKCSPQHPYTLMILNQGKVYNIKIRNQGNSYSLGNGLSNTKSFPGVKEMITHHTHMPLLLIDATDQHSEEQAQCCLQHPAGL